MTRVLVLTVALLASGGAVAIAAGGIPGAGGVIQGCYSTASGDLRVVTAVSQCKPAEAALSWSQAGPQGPRGLAWRGHYSNLAGYLVDDAVEYNGSAYIAIAPVPGGCSSVTNCGAPNAPPNPQFWSLLAQKGDAGTTGPTGPQGLVWRGTYSNASTYAVNDAVQYAGSSFVAVGAIAPQPCSTICIDPNAPGTSSKWQLIASAGSATTGPAGPQGPAGITEALDVVQVDSNQIELGWMFDPNNVFAYLPATEILHLSLPSASYMVFAQVRFLNATRTPLGDAARTGYCELRPDNVLGPISGVTFASRGAVRTVSSPLALNDPISGTLTLQLPYRPVVAETAPTGVDLVCVVPGVGTVDDPHTGLFATARIDAIQITSFSLTQVVP